MIDDALAGKIDRIVTKSVSRFARNTVDTLTTIRKLKEKGVGVTFEKENIDTLDSKGELLITIMSSLAQEESRSISENVTWGWRKRILDGKVSVAYSHFLGYEKGEDGSKRVVESEAKIVQQIYGMFLDGQTPSSIASFLTKQRVPTPAGKEKWQSSTVKSILTNLRAKEAISEQTGRRRKLEAFMNGLSENDFLTAFDERMFLGTTEKITVSKGQRKSEKQLVFHFKDGTEVTVTI